MNKPERVLVLITSLDRGGAETMVMNYYRHFDRSKIQYDFLVNRDSEGSYEKEILALGGRIFRMTPMYPQYFSRYKDEFRHFLSKHSEYKIIHSHLEERSYFPLRIAEEFGVPVRIAHAHNVYRQFDVKQVFREYFRYKLRNHVTHAFACSKEAGLWLFGDEIVNSDEYVHVYNAIDLSLYHFNLQSRNETRSKLGINSKSVVFGNVGRLSKQKNQKFLLDVYSDVLKEMPNSNLLIIGDGEMRADLYNYSKRIGIKNNIIFTGSVPDVWNYLQAMDCFVFPSRFEGLGMALVEAQVTGLPCIASEAVPREADVSDNVLFLPLTSKKELWVRRCIDLGHLSRNNEYNSKISHYDISVEAKKLQQFYLDVI